MNDLFDIITGLSNIGSFMIAGIIALIGIVHTKKKNIDRRVYECLEKILEVKRKLEFSLIQITEVESGSNFKVLNTEYSYFVSSIESFSSKIINQNLYKTKAFRDFQGKDSNSFIELILIILMVYDYIEKNRSTFNIKQSNSTTSESLKKTFKLLEKVLTPQSYEEIIKKCEEYKFKIVN